MNYEIHPQGGLHQRQMEMWSTTMRLWRLRPFCNSLRPRMSVALPVSSLDHTPRVLRQTHHSPPEASIGPGSLHAYSTHTEEEGESGGIMEGSEDKGRECHTMHTPHCLMCTQLDWWLIQLHTYYIQSGVTDKLLEAAQLTSVSEQIGLRYRAKNLWPKLMDETITYKPYNYATEFKHLTQFISDRPHETHNTSYIYSIQYWLDKWHVVSGWPCMRMWGWLQGVTSVCRLSAWLTASASGSNTDAVKWSSKNSRNSLTTAAASFPSRDDKKSFSFVLECVLPPFKRKNKQTYQ